LLIESITSEFPLFTSSTLLEIVFVSSLADTHTKLVSLPSVIFLTSQVSVDFTYEVPHPTVETAGLATLISNFPAKYAVS